MQISKEPAKTTSIQHRVEVEATPMALYAALTDEKQLAAWWTTRVQASAKAGSVARFTFGESHETNMRIERLVPGGEVAWRCVSGPWEGMDFNFEIREHERGSVLVFRNDGWPGASEFYMHCNCKWGFFLSVSLKGLLETNTGVPHPGEPKI